MNNKLRLKLCGFNNYLMLKLFILFYSIMQVNQKFWFNCINPIMQVNQKVNQIGFFN